MTAKDPEPPEMQRALAHIDALFAAVEQQPDVPPTVVKAFTAIRNIDPCPFR